MILGTRSPTTLKETSPFLDLLTLLPMMGSVGGSRLFTDLQIEEIKMSFGKSSIPYTMIELQIGLLGETLMLSDGITKQPG